MHNNPLITTIRTEDKKSDLGARKHETTNLNQHGSTNPTRTTSGRYQRLVCRKEQSGQEMGTTARQSNRPYPQNPPLRKKCYPYQNITPNIYVRIFCSVSSSFFYSAALSPLLSGLSRLLSGLSRRLLSFLLYCLASLVCC
jgi:hypothetical protein